MYLLLFYLYFSVKRWVSFCRKIGINCSDGKTEITSRIVTYLKTGKIEKKDADKTRYGACGLALIDLKGEIG